MEKAGKKKEKGKNETGFRWTYSPTGRINWTGRASIIRCTNPGPGICFEIHKSRLVLSCMHPFPVVVRPMSTNVLVFSVFTHQYPGHCNLSPPSCYALHPSPICILPHPVYCHVYSLSLRYRFFIRTVPDPASTRIIERLPFRDTYGVILLGGSEDSLFLSRNEGKISLRFFY